MDYFAISKITMSHLYKSYQSLDDSPLPPEIRKLVEIRTSQINQCSYCCKVHSEEARKLSIAQEKLDALPTWNTSSLFSKKEKIILDWCERVTHAKEADDDMKKIVVSSSFRARNCRSDRLCCDYECA